MYSRTEFDQFSKSAPLPVMPKNTGWKQRLVADSRMGTELILESEDKRYQINEVKIRSTLLSIIEFSGTAVALLYKKIAALELFKPHINFKIDILGDIKIFMGKIRVSVSQLRKNNPEGADALIDTLYQLIESEIEPGFASVRPYVSQALQIGIPQQELTPEPVSMMILPRSSCEISTVIDTNQGSTEWREERTHNEHTFIPVDRTLALKEIKIKGIEIEFRDCNVELAKAFHASADLNSHPSTANNLVLGGETVIITMDSLPDDNELLTHAFNILEKFIPHCESIRPKVDAVICAFSLLEKNVLRRCFKGIYLPNDQLLQSGSFKKHILGSNETVQAVFSKGRDTIEAFRSSDKREDYPITEIITHRETTYTWEYNGDYWDRNTRVYQDIWFDTPERARLVYNLLDKSEIKKTARVWEVCVYQERCIRYDVFRFLSNEEKAQLKTLETANDPIALRRFYLDKCRTISVMGGCLDGCYTRGDVSVHKVKAFTFFGDRLVNTSKSNAAELQDQYLSAIHPDEVCSDAVPPSDHMGLVMNIG